MAVVVETPRPDYVVTPGGVMIRRNRVRDYEERCESERNANTIYRDMLTALNTEDMTLSVSVFNHLYRDALTEHPLYGGALGKFHSTPQRGIILNKYHPYISLYMNKSAYKDTDRFVENGVRMGFHPVTEKLTSFPNEQVKPTWDLRYSGMVDDGVRQCANRYLFDAVTNDDNCLFILNTGSSKNPIRIMGFYRVVRIRFNRDLFSPCPWVFYLKRV